MMRRVLAAVFAVAVVAGFAIGFGASPAVAEDGAAITISPFHAQQNVYRTVDGKGFPASMPVRLFVSSPAREPAREIGNDGMLTGADGSIWFQILPEGGFGFGDLTNGVWTMRVCGGMVCYDLQTFIGANDHVIPTGLPARLCTPRITPLRDFPTFGPPGEAIDPWSGFTFNDIVQYCGPYATPWNSIGTFLVPTNWYPGMVVPSWPYGTVYPWPAYWYGNTLYGGSGFNLSYPAWCQYQLAC